MKRTLLWVGDAGCESGFAKNTHNVIEGLLPTWQVAVLGINFRGDQHNYPYPMHPAYVPGADILGVKRIVWACQKYRPDVIVLQNDPWNLPAYFKQLASMNKVPPVVGIVAVDGKNCQGQKMIGLSHAILWTEFARREALDGGFQEATSVIPLGVDQRVYFPMADRRKLRMECGLPFDHVNGFIVGNINRNQPRKRLDLTIQYFYKWVAERKIKDAFLYLHVAPTGDQGYDCKQLSEYWADTYGVPGHGDRLILAEPEMYHGTTEDRVAKTLNCFDVQLTTTQGEGWGLTTQEGMACGVPQIVPKWSALGEWCEDAAFYLKDLHTCTTPMVNAIGAVPGADETVAALDLFYNNRGMIDDYGIRGFDLVSQDRFRWKTIAQQHADVIGSVWSRRCRLHD